MNTATHQVLTCIAGEVLDIAHTVFDENGLRNSSIREKIEVELLQEPDTIIKILFENYLDFIENGRKADSGEIPPISEIRDWAQRKGLPATNDVLYAIANTLRKDGIEARPILSVIDDRLDKAFDERWADELFDAVTAELTQLLG